MLKNCVSAVLLLGAAAVASPPAFAAPPVPQGPKVSSIVPVQGWGERWGEHGGERWGERCHWLRERIHELEGRVYYAQPWERPRLEHRLFELREEFRGTCRRGY
jgi:hypothetical protein